MCKGQADNCNAAAGLPVGVAIFGDVLVSPPEPMARISYRRWAKAVASPELEVVPLEVRVRLAGAVSFVPCVLWSVF